MIQTNSRLVVQVKKTVTITAMFLCISMLILTVNAQTNQNPSSVNIVGGLLIVVVLAVILAIIGYGAYKLIRKWSAS